MMNGYGVDFMVIGPIEGSALMTGLAVRSDPRGTVPVTFGPAREPQRKC
jgi:hypothetical protein